MGEEVKAPPLIVWLGGPYSSITRMDQSSRVDAPYIKAAWATLAYCSTKSSRRRIKNTGRSMDLLLYFYHHPTKRHAT